MSVIPASSSFVFLSAVYAGAATSLGLRLIKNTTAVFYHDRRRLRHPLPLLVFTASLLGFISSFSSLWPTVFPQSNTTPSCIHSETLACVTFNSTAICLQIALAIRARAVLVMTRRLFQRLFTVAAFILITTNLIIRMMVCDESDTLSSIRMTVEAEPSANECIVILPDSMVTVQYSLDLFSSVSFGVIFCGEILRHLFHFSRRLRRQPRKPAAHNVMASPPNQLHLNGQMAGVPSRAAPFHAQPHPPATTPLATSSPTHFNYGNQKYSSLMPLALPPQSSLLPPPALSPQLEFEGSKKFNNPLSNTNKTDGNNNIINANSNINNNSSSGGSNNSNMNPNPPKGVKTDELLHSLLNRSVTALLMATMVTITAAILILGGYAADILQVGVLYVELSILCNLISGAVIIDRKNRHQHQHPYDASDDPTSASSSTSNSSSSSSPSTADASGMTAAASSSASSSSSSSGAPPTRATTRSSPMEKVIASPSAVAAAHSSTNVVGHAEMTTMMSNNNKHSNNSHFVTPASTFSAGGSIPPPVPSPLLAPSSSPLLSPSSHPPPPPPSIAATATGHSTATSSATATTSWTQRSSRAAEMVTIVSTTPLAAISTSVTNPLSTTEMNVNTNMRANHSNASDQLTIDMTMPMQDGIDLSHAAHSI